jgi:hypothetical protein
MGDTVMGPEHSLSESKINKGWGRHKNKMQLDSHLR